MSIEIKRVEPEKLPPPQEVTAVPAAWPQRQLRVIAHVKGRKRGALVNGAFGQVPAPCISVHFKTSAEKSFGAGAVFTLDEFREVLDALHELVDGAE